MLTGLRADQQNGTLPLECLTPDGAAGLTLHEYCGMNALILPAGQVSA